jgi:hypothetical protein
MSAANYILDVLTKDIPLDVARKVWARARSRCEGMLEDPRMKRSSERCRARKDLRLYVSPPKPAPTITTRGSQFISGRIIFTSGKRERSEPARAGVREKISVRYEVDAAGLCGRPPA